MSDQKDAVIIGVTLSGQIMAASLSMIAIIGAFATYVIDKRDVGVFYFFISGASFVCFILSILFGGRGIDKARKKGYNGTWSISETKSMFNLQAIFSLLGIIFFSVSIFIGDEKQAEFSDKLHAQDVIIGRLAYRDSIYHDQINKLTLQVESLSNELKARPGIKKCN